eukprot:CAMPEP_0184381788 /NCGR_PEP_ID=MMETSP0007-20130409/5798_1 /TAXON_ID=97485 /ORGANISM="Prymnesium parvum, Strain Texoma1" /LENGTH=89 /DNA_ID=CAMNT_0026727541 /DNA_START=148 /DNA_END=413 /DNA_ORIENTATION=+
MSWAYTASLTWSAAGRRNLTPFNLRSYFVASTLEFSPHGSKRSGTDKASKNVSSTLTDRCPSMPKQPKMSQHPALLGPYGAMCCFEECA